MHHSQAISFLPVVWAVVTSLMWRHHLRRPIFFLVVALLIGLGAETVTTFLWLIWQATNNQFIALTATELQHNVVADDVIEAFGTFAITAPILYLLRKHL